MEFLLILLIGAVTFGVCFLLDKGFTKAFRSKPQHKSGQSVRLSQHYGGAGVILGLLGLLALFQSTGSSLLLICGSFAEMQTMDLLWRAIYCLAGEAIAVLIACLVINIVVMIRYDGKGNERKKKAVRR